jgi:hypothetical protein
MALFLRTVIEIPKSFLKLVTGEIRDMPCTCQLSLKAHDVKFLKTVIFFFFFSFFFSSFSSFSSSVSPSLFFFSSFSSSSFSFILLLFLLRYNSDKVLTFSTIAFHLRRSWTCSLHFISFILFKSFLTSSFHRDLGLLTCLLVNSLNLYIFFTILISGIPFYLCVQTNSIFDL